MDILTIPKFKLRKYRRAAPGAAPGTLVTPVDLPKPRIERIVFDEHTCDRHPANDLPAADHAGHRGHVEKRNRHEPGGKGRGHVTLHDPIHFFERGPGCSFVRSASAFITHPMLSWLH